MRSNNNYNSDFNDDDNDEDEDDDEDYLFLCICIAKKMVNVFFLFRHILTRQVFQNKNSFCSCF